MKSIGDNKAKQHDAVDDDKYLIDNQVNEQNKLTEIRSSKTTSTKAFVSVSNSKLTIDLKIIQIR